MFPRLLLFKVLYKSGNFNLLFIKKYMKKQKASLIGKERTLQLVLLSNFIAAHFL